MSNNNPSHDYNIEKEFLGKLLLISDTSDSDSDSFSSSSSSSHCFHSSSENEDLNTPTPISNPTPIVEGGKDAPTDDQVGGVASSGGVVPVASGGGVGRKRGWNGGDLGDSDNGLGGDPKRARNNRELIELNPQPKCRICGEVFGSWMAVWGHLVRVHRIGQFPIFTPAGKSSPDKGGGAASNVPPK